MTEVINFRDFVSGTYKKEELTPQELHTYETAKVLVVILAGALAIKFIPAIAVPVVIEAFSY
jgi:hypothetical protein